MPSVTEYSLCIRRWTKRGAVTQKFYHPVQRELPARMPVEPLEGDHMRAPLTLPVLRPLAIAAAVAVFAALVAPAARAQGRLQVHRFRRTRRLHRRPCCGRRCGAPGRDPAARHSRAGRGAERLGQETPRSGEPARCRPRPRRRGHRRCAHGTARRRGAPRAGDRADRRRAPGPPLPARVLATAAGAEKRRRHRPGEAGRRDRAAQRAALSAFANIRGPMEPAAPPVKPLAGIMLARLGAVAPAGTKNAVNVVLFGTYRYVRHVPAISQRTRCHT